MIEWPQIGSVRDVDSAIVLTQKDGVAIAVPKAGIPEMSALWALLEDRLVSKRGLIRSPAPRKNILNSAY